MSEPASPALLAPPAPPGLVPRAEPPTFSVIVAAHQAAATIAEAVRSALTQDPAPHEVVVCDDGSTDDIVGALEPFGDAVILLRKARGGEGSAKNAAARAASGDFVVILDADDVFLPGRLAALGRLAMTRPDLDLLTTDAYLEVAGERITRSYADGYDFEVDDQREGILRRNFIFGLAAIRRSRFLEVGGFSEEFRYTADWDCWIRLVLGGSRAGLVDAPLAAYRLHQTSLNANRLAMYQGRATTLGRAWARDDLTERERATVRERLDHEARRIALESLLCALETGHLREARSLGLALARRDDVLATARMKAAAAVVAPRLAATVVRRQRSRYWTAVGDRRLPRRS